MCKMNEDKPSKNKYGWVVVALAFTTGFITDGLSFSFGILMVELLEQFQEDRAETSVIISVMQATRHIIGPVTGTLCEKYGHRVVVVLGALISSIGFVISVFANNVLFLTFTYGFLGGLGFGLVYPPGNICVLQHFKSRRSLATGVAACGSGVGSFCISRLLHLLIDYYGWRGTILLQAALVLQCVLCGLLLKQPDSGKNTKLVNLSYKLSEITKSDNKDHSRKTGEINVPTGNVFTVSTDENAVDKFLQEDNSVCKDPSKDSSSRNKTPELYLHRVCDSMFSLKLLKDIRCWLFLLSTAMFELAFIITLSFLPDQGTLNGMSKDETAWLISSIGISNTLSRVCIGWIGDLHFVNRMILLEVILVLVGVSTAMSVFLMTFTLKLSFTSFYGFLVGGFITLCPVVLTDVFGAEMISKTYGLLMLSIGVSDIMSTPFGGWLFDISGSYNVTFIVAGIAFVLSGLFLVFLHLVIKHRRQS